MNNLDKIIEKIMLEADSEADKIISAAELEADTIITNGKERAEDIVKAANARAQRESTAAFARADGAADMKRREIVLKTKVGLINRAFSEANDYLLSLDHDDYVVFLGHLLADAVGERVLRVAELKSLYGNEEEYSLDFVVLFNKKDKAQSACEVVKAAKEFLKRKSKAFAKTAIAISEDTADIDGGLILKYGDIESNCSVAAVIDEARRKCEAEVTRLLFTKEDKEDIAK